MLQGYKKGDVLGIMLPNTPNYILTLTGAIGAGAIMTTINPSYTSHEVARQLKMAKAKALITNCALLPVATEAVQLLGIESNYGRFPKEIDTQIR